MSRGVIKTQTMLTELKLRAEAGLFDGKVRIQLREIIGISEMEATQHQVAKFRVGMQVSFVARRGSLLYGKVRKINPKKIKVEVSHQNGHPMKGIWSVPHRLLAPASHGPGPLGHPPYKRKRRKVRRPKS